MVSRGFDTSFVVISDDRKHDSPYALLAVEKIITYLKQNSCDSIKKIPLYKTAPLASIKIAFSYMD